jgi:hypothetical protein
MNLFEKLEASKLSSCEVGLEDCDGSGSTKIERPSNNAFMALFAIRFGQLTAPFLSLIAAILIQKFISRVTGPRKANLLAF